MVNVLVLDDDFYVGQIHCQYVNDVAGFRALDPVQDLRTARKVLAEEIKPEFVSLIEGGKFVPTYAEYIYLKGRRVLADQMEFLLGHFPRTSPLHTRLSGKLGTALT